jgi:cyclase
VKFENLRDAGDPVQLADRYTHEGADELVFLDISATKEGRRTFAELVKDVAAVVNIPFTVGGGIRSVSDVGRMLESGADKISVNTAAIQNPGLLDELALEFGSQCIVIAIDARFDPESNAYRLSTHGGSRMTSVDAHDWAREATARGAGEILLTSMDRDGTKEGFELALTHSISEVVTVPVIASGGAGSIGHFVDVFKEGDADAGLAASIFHFGEIPIQELKNGLATEGIAVRPTD